MDSCVGGDGGGGSRVRRARRVPGEGRVEGLQGERKTWSTADGLEGR